MTDLRPGEQRTIECCGWKCEQGRPAPWTCPGCGKVWEPPADDDPGMIEP